ncbi:MAG: hypothetical protein K0M58_09600 [Thiobacillus sp.]|nr:hypothetical protein [Thiobacillus sp.]
MNRNWIEGVAEQGERARFREALAIKARRCGSGESMFFGPLTKVMPILQNPQSGVGQPCSGFSRDAPQGAKGMDWRVKAASPLRAIARIAAEAAPASVACGMPRGRGFIKGARHDFGNQQ